MHSGDVNALFQVIAEATHAAFGALALDLLCEPGRAMMSEAFSLAARVKALRGPGTVYLNNGIYGGLADLRDMGLIDQVPVVASDGTPRQGHPVPRIVFEPTCDSLDRLPDVLRLPDDMEEGDYVIIDGMGAYSIPMATRFNGYGLEDIVTVRQLSGQ